MKCAFKDNNIYHGNCIELVERIYLCREHLIKVAELDSWNEGKKFIEMLK